MCLLMIGSFIIWIKKLSSSVPIGSSHSYDSLLGEGQSARQLYAYPVWLLGQVI